MPVSVKNLYNVGLNGKGYIFMGSPNSPAYTRSVIPTEINRLAISDISYSDFSGTGLFYIAQTDWSAGIKDEKVWRDDGKYYYSVNMDTYTNNGEIRVAKEFTAFKDFNANIYCGCQGTLATLGSDMYFGGGVYNNYVRIYKYDSGTFTDTSGTFFGTNCDLCEQLLVHKDTLFSFNYCTTELYILAMGTDSGGGAVSWADPNSGGAITAVRNAGGGVATYYTNCGVVVDSVLYFVGGNVDTNYSILSTDDAGSSWSEVVYKVSDFNPVSAIFYNNLYCYLLFSGNKAQLRTCDLSDGTDVLVYEFTDVDTIATAASKSANRFLVEYNGKLIITIPSDRIYEYDGTNITLIHKKDADKTTIGVNASFYLDSGCVVYNDRIHWGNLIYDGEAWFNWAKVTADPSYYTLPIFVNDNNVLYVNTNNDYTATFYPATTYKTTLANNYLVFNEMSPVVSIDKLLYSVTVIYKQFTDSFSTIKIEYSIDGMSNWVDISGSITQTTEGAASTKREIFIPGNVIFNKIWWRISMKGYTTTTPVIKDFIMAYKPLPDYKNKWSIALNTSNNFRLLNGQYEERSGDELNSELWNVRQLKQKVIFEDVDYVSCNIVSAMNISATSALIDNVNGLPRQGRIRAVSGGVAEEMTYTTAQTNKILGITRARRGTRAIAYPLGQTLKNDYDVYVENLQEQLTWTDQNKTESATQVTIIEA